MICNAMEFAILVVGKYALPEILCKVLTKFLINSSLELGSLLPKKNISRNKYICAYHHISSTIGMVDMLSIRNVNLNLIGYHTSQSFEVVSRWGRSVVAFQELLLPRFCFHQNIWFKIMVLCITLFFFFAGCDPYGKVLTLDPNEYHLGRTLQHRFYHINHKNAVFISFNRG